ncbi:hypothetical protein AVEN_237293-1 [Araneus ventricosus]|uniref:Uncharacterized protein n=1 Tax=Araneus ventricosus TaxID=182803 RepID=A0A4Y2DKF4_ARAVE|nr:hypothetical protein AVEN_237293-1 [Araneus ventricosus]
MTVKPRKFSILGKTYIFFPCLFWRPRGLVARSRPRDWRVTGPKPDSTEDPPCMEPAARSIIRSGQTPSRRRGVEAWRGGASSVVVPAI